MNYFWFNEQKTELVNICDRNLVGFSCFFESKEKKAFKKEREREREKKKEGNWDFAVRFDDDYQSAVRRCMTLTTIESEQQIGFQKLYIF